jgi:hypothetical protein
MDAGHHLSRHVAAPLEIRRMVVADLHVHWLTRQPGQKLIRREQILRNLSARRRPHSTKLRWRRKCAFTIKDTFIILGRDL